MASRPKVVAALGLLLASPTTAVEPIDPLTAGEPMVLTFFQGRTRVADGVLGFRDGAGKMFLPLAEISRGLGFAITVDSIRRRADGFYLTEANRFHLDLDRGTVESAGRSFTVEDGAVVVGHDDVFVELTHLNTWFVGVDLAFESSALLVEVTSDPPLPALQRQRREESRLGLTATRGASSELELPVVRADYRAFSLPVIDVDSRADWSSRSGRSSSLALRGAHDLAGLGARWFFGLDDTMALSEARLSLGRKDPEGGLLGPLGLTEIELGDIGQFGTPLVSRGSRGAGVRLTNRPRDVTRGTTIELRGELPPGWEAELYRGGILLDFDVEPEKGEYVFADIALLAGINELVIVRHGPEGQRDQTTRRVRLGSSQPAPGAWYAEASALLQRLDTLDLGEGLGQDMSRVPPLPFLGATSALASTPVPVPSAGRSLDLGGLAAEARVVFGLRPGLSVEANWNTLSLGGEQIDYAGFSTEWSVAGVGLAFDSVMDQHRRWAAGGRLLASVAGVGVLVQHEEFAVGFRSPTSGGDRPLLRRSRLRLNRHFELPGAGLPVQAVLRGEIEHAVAAAPRMTLGLGASTSFGNLRLDQQLAAALSGNDWRLDEFDGRVSVSWRGLSPSGSVRRRPSSGASQGPSLASRSRRRQAMTWRGNLAYATVPEWRLTNLSLQASGRLGETGLRGIVTLGHDFDSQGSFGLGVGWSLPHVELSARCNYDTSGIVTAGLGMSFSLDWRHGRVRPRLEREPRSSQGLAHARVFVDHDRDGRPSPGEETLAGVRFNSGSRQRRTDDNGWVTLSGLPEQAPTDIVLNVDSLPDPFLHPSVPGYRVSVRPGAAAELWFPLVWVSDIEGMVRVDEPTVRPDGTPLGRRRRGLGNVELIVLDDNGNEVRRRRSEFDGFYTFSSLPAGHYTLRIAPEQADRFELDDSGGLEVTLQDDTAILTGVELLLVSSRPIVVAG